MWRFLLAFALLMVCFFGGCNKSVKKTDRLSHSFEPLMDKAACEALIVTEDDIRSIITQSPLVRGEVWHYHHHAAPCSHEGEINFNGMQRKYSYYPTGYMWLEGYEGWLMCYDCTVYPEWIVFDGEDEVSTTNGVEYKERYKDLIVTTDSPLE